MGLGAPKKRAKISHDPNNTAWSRSSAKYGQKILESKGWTSGCCLGAPNAPHAKLYSAASDSHIRIVLKDGSLGLGARRGVGVDDGKTTGLDVFHDLLGRLNGTMEEELEQEQKVRSNTKRSLFFEQRWGRPRFVSGGFLAGDQPQGLLDEQPSVDTTANRNMIEPEVVPCESKSYQDLSPMNAKRQEYEKEQGIRHAISDCGLVAVQSPSKTTSPPIVRSFAVPDACRAKRGVEKAKRKLEMHSRKEVKTKSGRNLSQAPMALPLEDPTPVMRLPKTSRLSKTPTSTTSRRNAVRQRYIHHKNMAMMDSKALNEILMIKS